MNKRLGGTPWKMGRRRRNPQAQLSHGEIAEAVAHFRDRGGIIRQLPPEFVPPRPGPGDRFDSPYVNVLGGDGDAEVQ